MIVGGGIHLATVNIVKKTLRTLCSENTAAQTREQARFSINLECTC